MKKNENTEVLTFDDLEQKIKEQKIREEKQLERKKEIEHQERLSKSVRKMQQEIKETNDILFSLLKVSIIFLVTIIIIILIKRAMD